MLIQKKRKENICDCFMEVPIVTSWPRLFQADTSHFSLSSCLPQWLHLTAFCYGINFTLNNRIEWIAGLKGGELSKAFIFIYSLKWTFSLCGHFPIELYIERFSSLTWLIPDPLLHLKGFIILPHWLDTGSCTLQSAYSLFSVYLCDIPWLSRYSVKRSGS